MRISDWSSDVCSSDLVLGEDHVVRGGTEGLEDRPDFGLRRSKVVAVRCEVRFERVGSPGSGGVRSEEHTSELQSLMRISYAVFCLKKKKTQTSRQYETYYTQNTDR